MPSAGDSARASTRFRILALAATIGAFLLFVVAAVALARHGDRTPHRGWTAAFEGRGLVVGYVEPGGPAAGRLEIGDRILAVDGDRRLDRLVAQQALGMRGLFLPGLDYTLTVVRRGERRSVPLRAGEHLDPAHLRLAQSLWLAAAVWCIVPALISLVKPGQPIARLAYWTCMFIGMAFLADARQSAMLWTDPPWRTALTMVYPFAPLHMAIAYDFYLRFPQPLVGGGWHGVRVALYAAIAAICAEGPLLDTLVRVLAPDRLPAVRAALAPVDQWVTGFELLLYPGAALAMFAVLARKYQGTHLPDERRRLNWLLWGTIVGLAPLTLILLLENAGRYLDRPVSFETWIYAANLTTVALPIALGYAIITQRVFDIRVVIRKGLQYLFARGALSALLAVPVIGLAYGIVTHRNTPLGELLLSNRLYIYLLGATLVSLWGRTRVMHWVDRRFFREAYDRERMLVELIEDVQQLESASSVSKHVSHALEAAFHPESLYIWYRDHDSALLSLSYSSGGYVHRPALEPGSPLLRLVESRRNIIELPLPAEDPLPDADREWLAEARVSHLVPLIGTGPDVLGLLMLGPKKSEEPYSDDDLKLLQAMARQIGLGRDNIRLHARVDHDRQVRHDVLSRLDADGFNLLKECPRCGRCYDAAAARCEHDGTELTLSLPVERTIEGKYRLDRLIGKGGMGAVYEATDLRLVRPVAVKVLLGREFGNQVALRRFEREAQACARLTHPNVVTVYDFGRAGADGAFLVMELVRGTTLRAELRHRTRIPPRLAVTWFDQICAGVGAAHQCGIVHRDLKPENVLVTTANPGVPLVKVLDFGLAKFRTHGADDASSLTEPGVIVGTLSYMAPEQLTGGVIDHRSDIFSMGVMAAEAVTGSRPFTGRTQGELLVSMLNDSLVVDSGAPGMAELERVLRRATAKDPSARHQSMPELGAELGAALRHLAALSASSEEDTTTTA